MITTYYGNPVGVARLRDLANVDAAGATMWSVAQAAHALGFRTRGLMMESQALRDLHLPAIVHWEGHHYVVLYEVTRKHVVIGDPSRGRRRITMEAFLEGWTKRALEIVPSDQLTQGDKPTALWRRFALVLTTYRGMLLEVLAASILLSGLGLGIPLFTQAVVDRVLVNRSVDLLNMLLVAMLGVSVFQAAIRTTRQLILIHLSTRFDARLLGDFFQHVFALPLRFFELRRVGDIVSRVRENEEIRHALTSTLPSIFLDTILAIAYLALLASYNSELTVVVCAVLPVSRESCGSLHHGFGRTNGTTSRSRPRHPRI